MALEARLNAICDAPPLTTSFHLRTHRRGRMDAGIVYRGGRPLFIIAAYTDNVPETMPDGLLGHAAASATIGQRARACWDELA